MVEIGPAAGLSEMYWLYAVTKPLYQQQRSWWAAHPFVKSFFALQLAGEVCSLGTGLGFDSERIIALER